MMELSNKSRYKVTYSVKKAMNNHGEYSGVQDIYILNGYSDTNDLQEIFTDLFYLHREDYIVGIEIESVETVLSNLNLAMPQKEILA